MGQLASPSIGRRQPFAAVAGSSAHRPESVHDSVGADLIDDQPGLAVDRPANGECRVGENVDRHRAGIFRPVRILADGFLVRGKLQSLGARRHGDESEDKDRDGPHHDPPLQALESLGPAADLSRRALKLA